MNIQEEQTKRKRWRPVESRKTRAYNGKSVFNVFREGENKKWNNGMLDY